MSRALIHSLGAERKPRRCSDLAFGAAFGLRATEVIGICKAVGEGVAFNRLFSIFIGKLYPGHMVCSPVKSPCPLMQLRGMS